MALSPIGQAMPSSANITPSSAIKISGEEIHAVPITWHRRKRSPTPKYCALTRLIMETAHVPYRTSSLNSDNLLES